LFGDIRHEGIVVAREQVPRFQGSDAGEIPADACPALIFHGRYPTLAADVPPIKSIRGNARRDKDNGRKNQRNANQDENTCRAGSHKKFLFQMISLISDKATQTTGEKMLHSIESSFRLMALMSIANSGITA